MTFMENKEMIYGTRAVMEAIRASRDIETILIQKGVNNDLVHELIGVAKKGGLPVSYVPEQKLASLSKKNHQGVIALLSSVHFESLENIVHRVFSEGLEPFILLLDRVTDVRNFGAIVRTAETAGIQAIVIPEKGSAPISADAMKTSAGALNHVPVCRVKNLKQTIRDLKNSGVKIVACTEHTSTIIFNTDLTGPLALIMGSEEDGVSTELLKEADQLGKIPMAGKIGSLNVSVSAGIALYEAVRQKGFVK
jgi:23S rRNA (guanosine2251-2'-O)-methyltransferase